MLTLLCMIGCGYLFWKLFAFSAKASWTILKFVLGICLIPIVVVVLIYSLIYLAVPILIIVGICALVKKAT